FDYAYMACKLAIEHMTPVILLTDGYLGNGSEAWKIKRTEDLAEINIENVESSPTDWKPYQRDSESLARKWVIPGMKGFEHRIGGLEKQDVTGNVSHDPENHEQMVKQRAKKVKRVENYIPLQKIKGKDKDGLLVVGWGGTYGTLFGAVNELQKQGENIGFSHFNYINPLPSNTAEIFSRFKKIVVCELNLGQFASHLRNLLPQFEYMQINKVQGQPFTIGELKEKISEIKI
ncbi:MAG: 2-oxoacid:acceptor oxidoreductase subunit alpha, partial [Bacteroidia bacterium]|nr:2-oxoacid:acceptor oxidoreductase subunit alpha [Bacteroidia bacterium]